MTEGSDAARAGLHLLFVCSANISRSPYAARRAAMVRPAGSLVARSAGIPGVAGREFDPAMAAELRARGGDPAGHVSRTLTADLLAGADLVLTMEFAHQLAILEAWPQSAGRVVSLGRLAEAARGAAPATPLGELLARARHLPDGMAWNVPDPYGRGQRAAARCADLIDSHLEVCLPALTGADLLAAPPAPPRRWWQRG